MWHPAGTLMFLGHAAQPSRENSDLFQFLWSCSWCPQWAQCPRASHVHVSPYVHFSPLDLQCTCLLVGPWGVQSIHTNVFQSSRDYPYKSLNRTAIGLLHQSQTSMKQQNDSSARMVLDNRLALDYLLGWEGGVWAERAPCAACILIILHKFRQIYKRWLNR